MNDPAVLLYTSDFLTGVMDMTMEERGQYITLLCYQHQKGHIKEETIRLLVGNVSDSVLTHFIQDEEGKYYNKRMDIEKEKRHSFVESRRENAKKGGRPRKEEIKPNDKPKKNLVVLHKDNLMGNENVNDNINDNIDNIYDYIESNFGRPLSPIEYEQVSTWEDTELTRYAIKQAILNGKYNLKYINAIISNYEKNRIQTIQEAQEEETRFKNKSIKPTWLDKEIESREATPEEEQAFLKELDEIYNS